MSTAFQLIGKQFAMRAAVSLLALLAFSGNLRAAIAQRGSATTAANNATGSGTLTINKPTGVVQGDVMIAVVVKGNGTTADPSLSGWTLIQGATMTGSTGKSNRGAVLYKVATASEGTSYAFSLGSAVSAAGTIVAFSGVDTNGGPFDVSSPAILVSGSATATSAGATAITTAGANTAVIMCGLGGNPGSSVTWSAWNTTTPGSLTGLVSASGGTSTDDRVTVGAAWATKATTGTTGAGSATLSTGCRNGGILIALKSLVSVSAANSTVSASPISVTAGTNTSTVTVTLKDGSSNPVAGKTVTLAKISGPGTPVIATTNSTSDASGIVRFTVSSTTAGTNVFQATDTTDSVTITQTATNIFTPGAVSATVSTVSAAPASVVANGATTSTVTVTLKDANSNAVSGKVVALGKISGPGAPVITTTQGTTDGNGVATFTVKSTTTGVDIFQATNTTDGIVVTATATVTFTPGAVSAAVSQVAASPGSVPADGVTTATVSVTLLDANSNAVPGKAVTLGKISGPGTPTITTTQGTTDTNGVALFTVKSITLGTDVFQATNTTDGIIVTQTASVVFTPTSAADATNSTVTASPASLPADGFTTTTITVTLKNTNNAPVPGKTVTLASDRGATDTISAASGLSDISGVVTFTVKSSTIGSPVFTATDVDDGITIVQTATATFVAAPTQLSFITVPATGTAGVAFSVTVQSQDSGGNPLNVGSATTVTLSKASGGGALSGTLAGVIPAGTNKVTISTPVYSKADTLTLTATASGAAALLPATSSGIVFSAGTVSAAASTLTALPTSIVADGVTTSSVTVTLKDVNSNSVAGKAVTLVKASGPGAPVITTTQGTTDTNGVATFTVQSTTAGAVAFQATDTTDSILVTPTATVTFTAGAVSAGTSTVASSPASVVADGVTTSTITVTLKDANSNAVPGKTVALGKISGSGTPTITTTQGTTDAGGVATFTVKSTTVSTNVFQATNTTDNIVVAQTVTVIFTASSAKDFLTFGANVAGSTAVINTTNDTVVWTLPAGTVVTSLSPAYTVSQYASGSPVSGTARNFATPQTYVITAQDGSTATYTVTAKVVGPQTYGITMATDLAQEFSPMNLSGHPVVTGLNNYPNSTAPKALAAAQMKAPWNVNVGSQTMLCSDCHDATTTNYVASAAQGPHGSANQYMLRGPNAANWPNVASFASSWCVNCHNAPVTFDGSHENHNGATACYQCHIVIPHGGKLSRLLADGDSLNMPARYAYNNQPTNVLLRGYTKPSGTYQTANCGAAGSCAGTHPISNGGQW